MLRCRKYLMNPIASTFNGTAMSIYLHENYPDYDFYQISKDVELIAPDVVPITHGQKNITRWYTTDPSLGAPVYCNYDTETGKYYDNVSELLKFQNVLASFSTILPSDTLICLSYIPYNLYFLTDQEYLPEDIEALSATISRLYEESGLEYSGFYMYAGVPRDTLDDLRADRFSIKSGTSYMLYHRPLLDPNYVCDYAHIIRRCTKYEYFWSGEDGIIKCIAKRGEEDYLIIFNLSEFKSSDPLLPIIFKDTYFNAIDWTSSTTPGCYYSYSDVQ